MRISDFLGYFYPDENEIIHGRVIRPKGSQAYPPAAFVSFTRHQLQTDKDLQQKLRKWNQTHGIYFVVNAGGQKDDEITRINAVFCEMDDRPLQEQYDIYEFCPLTPSLLVQTKKSVHAYWLLEEPILPSEFITLQKGLIKHFESDGKICNPSRVMRVPYFNHLSIVDGETIRIPIRVQAAQGFTYSYAEIFNEFPFEHPKPKTYPKAYKHTSNEAGEELVRRIKGSAQYHTSGEYGYTQGICHEGKGNNGIFVHLPTGAVKCFKGCSWFDIASSFGIVTERKIWELYT